MDALLRLISFAAFVALFAAWVALKNGDDGVPVSKRSTKSRQHAQPTDPLMRSSQ
jgi:hypothetical protein